ncbi:MAG: copper resistance protein CopC [Corynebacterium sp.]|nr:copper resistance protein CopC [Corynebacterium sp.]
MKKSTLASQVALAIVGALLTILGLSSHAYAHDALLSSNPAQGSVLSEMPRDFEMTFSGNSQDQFNTVALSNTDTGDIIYSTTPQVEGNLVTFSLPDTVEAIDGNYTVGYQITSSDGHAVRGRFDFVVDSAEESSTAATGENAADNAGENSGAAEEGNSAESSGMSPLVWIVIIALVLIGLVIFALRKRK